VEADVEEAAMGGVEGGNEALPGLGFGVGGEGGDGGMAVQTKRTDEKMRVGIDES
jgi:hypothetical protein